MPASVYDLAQFHQATSQIAGHSVLAPWFYPPTFLLLVAPLALLSYYAALACWLSLGLGAYSLVVWRIAPHPTALWLALAFPATLTNLSYGQNGLFSTALIGGGMLLLNSSPILAGIFLGLLSYKPNFFILIPVALIAGRHWRALGATLISALILAISSVLVFGWEPWAAYWSVRHIPMEAVEHGIASLKIMPTVFAATRMAGGSLTGAYLLQGVAAAASLSAVIWIWSRKTPMAIRVSVLILGSLLFTPYGSEYELVRLAIPLAWIGWEGFTRGWLPREKTFLILGWFTPYLSRLLAEVQAIFLVPPILVALLYLNLTSPRLSPNTPGPSKNDPAISDPKS